MAKIITENFRIETTNELFSSFKNQNQTLSDNFLSQLQAYDDGEQGTGFNLGIQEEIAIQQLVKDQLNILRPESNYYIVASATSSTSEDPITNTQKSKREFQRRMVFGNKVSDDSARYMFYENAWVSGTIYDAYDDMVDIEESNTVVTVRNAQNEYLVFKCIENNGGAPSLVSPQTIASQFTASNYQALETEDKYIWHYMFTVTSDEAEKYKTSDSLPLPISYGDANVILNAKENISQIIIESTPSAQFNQYLFGEATSTSNSSDVLITSTVQNGELLDVSLKITNKIGRTLYNDPDSYKNMYLRSAEGSTQGKLYDVVASLSNNSTKEITVTLDTTDAISGVAQLVPKILVSSSTLGGEQCKAYGVLDQFGTLRRIAFENKGSHYKFAEAEVSYPKSLTGPGVTELRAVVSPKGGHGSNPIDEMSMSRLSIVTNFSGDDSHVPKSNLYSQVGLIKNPLFKDSSGNDVEPEGFDNRVKVTYSTAQPALFEDESITSWTSTTGSIIRQIIQRIDVRGIQGNNDYVINDLGELSTSDWQALGATTVALGASFTSVANPSPSLTKRATISFAVGTSTGSPDEEIITAKLHALVNTGDTTGTPNTGELYLVDQYGAFESKLHSGPIMLIRSDQYIEGSSTQPNGMAFSINNFSDIAYGEYVPYSGELLHFINFSPVTRRATAREKVKFTFDF